MMHHFTDFCFSKPPTNHFTEQSFYRTLLFSVNHESFYRTIILTSSKVRRTQQIISPSLQKILHPETFQRQFPLVACFTPVLLTSKRLQSLDDYTRAGSLWTTTSGERPHPLPASGSSNRNSNAFCRLREFESDGIYPHSLHHTVKCAVVAVPQLFLGSKF